MGSEAENIIFQLCRFLTEGAGIAVPIFLIDILLLKDYAYSRI